MGETVCRALTLPFRPASGDWAAFDALARACWAESTALANWAAQEMFRADVVRTPGMAKLPPAPRVELYKLFQRYEGRAAWAGAAAAANCVLRAVQRKYLRERFDVIWRRARMVPTYRYPYPFPVHNQNWAAAYGPAGEPLVTLALPGGRVTLELRRGQEFRRQLALFRLLESGAARRGEAALLRKGRHTLLKLVGHFPARPAGGLTGTLLVRTDPAAFWVAEPDGRAPWILNADHVRRRCEAHRVFLRRSGEDLKLEARLSESQRRHLNDARADRCRKHRDRVAAFLHAATRQLADFAVRQRCACVLYDDVNRDYLPSFPWAEVKEKLGYKLAERGITFTPAAEVGAETHAEGV